LAFKVVENGLPDSRQIQIQAGSNGSVVGNVSDRTIDWAYGLVAYFDRYSALTASIVS